MPDPILLAFLLAAVFFALTGSLVVADLVAAWRHNRSLDADEADAAWCAEGEPHRRGVKGT